MQSEPSLNAMTSKRDNLAHAIKIWQAGVERVKGEPATRSALAEDSLSPFFYILAIGKAAASMMLGAADYLTENGKALVVTKYDHTDDLLRDDPRINIIESGHPLPDENSLRAGKAVYQFIESIPEDGELLILVSGGASSLVEYPIASMTLDKLQNLSKMLLANGYSIDQINTIRMRVSQIKGGKLLQQFKGKSVNVYGLSDIPGDDANLISSGIAAIESPKVEEFIIPPEIEQLLETEAPRSKLNFTYQSKLIGSNQLARTAAAEMAEQLGVTIVEQLENIAGDILVLAPILAQRLKAGRAGVYIWGGEPTVQLPKNPGQGGRNQSLTIALAIALTQVHGQENIGSIDAVVAGTDGTDGVTSAAGGLLWPRMDLSGAADALSNADAMPWLQQRNALFKTGPTGTNVMDLIIAIKS